MKYLFIIAFTFVLIQGWGQKTTTIQTIPDDGSTLRKNWKWHPGDNPAWANPAFNDQNWPQFATTKSIQAFPKLREAQIGWFRRPIKLAQSLTNKPLYISIRQMGASEIYLDGKLLHKIGVVSPNPKLEVVRTHAELLPISFPDTNLHTLAVRFSFTKANFYYPGTSKGIFQLTLLDIEASGEKAFVNSQRTNGLICFCIGIFLVFSILHFLFYASNRQQKVSLWLGFTLLFFVITFLTALIGDYYNQIAYQQINELATLIFFYMGVLFINVCLYLYLSQPFRFFFYLQVAVLIGSLFCLILDLNLPYGIELWPCFLFIFVDFIRVSILANKRKNPNANVPIYSLVTVGASFTMVIIFSMVMSFMIDDFKNIEDFTEIIIFFSVGMFLIMCLSIPVGLSFSLVREYSRTHKALRKKIQEIETLSAKSIAQEQEKQHILTIQNETLEHQVAERTAELHQSLISLKSTQDQLIQSEKLASLGELTAGIAHEIQNPLNFVNNFSELSVELIEECPQPPEGAKEDWLPEEAPFGGWGAFLADLRQNLQKINHHGKRASSIVRGMLEHSRQSTGEQELTDINQLADEYLRLAYHGLRAKDKDGSAARFNADYELITDPNLPKINVVPQDIGRVLLNLINNAFQSPLPRAAYRPGGGINYRKKVTVKTFKIEGDNSSPSGDGPPRGWGASVSDNGAGIPTDILPKIFQPFFTTKPTGEGTGLGLSLAYDIITKGHGGTLEVESVEGEGATFTIKIPLSTN